jgi:hypothetical protein
MKKAANRDVFRYIVAPLLFLTVALAGGLRFQLETSALEFVPPQLISCILGLLAMVLLVRGGPIRVSDYFGDEEGVIGSVSGAVRMTAIFLATVQVFNVVTPERGLLNFIFNLFYFLILLNDLFIVFSPRRLAAALASVLGVSFVFKYVLLADLLAPSQSWGKYILQELMKTASLGALDYQAFAPATGYLALFTLMLYALGLYLVAPRTEPDEVLAELAVINRNRMSRMTPAERRRLLTAVSISEISAHAEDAKSPVNDDLKCGISD